MRSRVAYRGAIGPIPMGEGEMGLACAIRHCRSDQWREKAHHRSERSCADDRGSHRSPSRGSGLQGGKNGNQTSTARRAAAAAGCPRHPLHAADQGRADAVCQIGVTEPAYYRWRKQYRGLNRDQLKRLKELETENQRLRRAVSVLIREKMIPTDAARGNF